MLRGQDNGKVAYASLNLIILASLGEYAERQKSSLAQTVHFRTESESF